MDNARQMLLEYARFHGLSRDHSIPIDENTDYSATVVHDLSLDIADSKDVPILHIPVTYNQVEKLTLTSNGAELLSSVVFGRPISSEEPDVYDVRRCNKLKLDLPLLKVDAELDLNSFGSSKLDENLTFAKYTVDTRDEDYEGLPWFSDGSSLLSKYDHLSDTEKLEVSKESVLWLHAVLTETYSTQDVYTNLATPLLLFKDLPGKYASSPLLPLSPLLGMSHKSSPIFTELKLLSEFTSPINKEIEDIERRLMKENDPILCHGGELISRLTSNQVSKDGQQQATSPETCEIMPYASSPLRSRAFRMKVDVPLTPPLSRSPVKHISWSDELVQIIPDFQTTYSSFDIQSDDDLESFFNDIIEPAALRVEQQIHDERLQEVDSTKRVPVPVMEFSIPEPLWRIEGHEAELDEDIKRLMLMIAKMKCHYWSVSKIERELPWNPFPPHLGKVVLDENIEETEECSRLLGSIGDENPVGIETLTWKPDGLRIFDIDEDEENEYLQSSVYEEPALDIDRLVDKRKRTIENSQISTQEGLGTSFIKSSSSVTNPQYFIDCRAMGIAIDSAFSTTNELDRFMSIQSSQATKRLKITHAPSAHLPQTQLPPLALEKSPPLIKAIPCHPAPADYPRLPYPEPTISNAQAPQPGIISSSFLQDRHQLIRHIIRLLPSITFIERNTATATSNTQITMHSNTNGADLTISPGIGLLCTTLQEVKQKSLPGQAPSPTSIRSRIIAAAPCFDHLIILVSAGRSAPNHIDDTLDERDCSALNELTAFTTALLPHHDVTTTFIGGCEDELARWITGLVCSAAPSAVLKDLALLQEVTLWELFLTRAGMNAFAAQAVLSVLKAPAVDVSEGGSEHEGAGRDDRGDGGKKYGLAAFVAMDAAERMARFEGLFGGRKVLEKVGRLLDMGWTQCGGRRVSG